MKMTDYNYRYLLDFINREMKHCTYLQTEQLPVFQTFAHTEYYRGKVDALRSIQDLLDTIDYIENMLENISNDEYTYSEQ